MKTMLHFITAWPWRTILRRMFKTALYLGLFFFVIFTVLTNLGGNGDVYKNAIQDYLSQSTGYHTQIAKLNMMRFYPDIVIDVEGVEMLPPDSENAVVTIGAARMVFGFFDIVFSTRRFKALEFEKVQAVRGVLIPQTFRLEHLGIVEAPEGSFLRAAGWLDTVPFQASFGLEGQGRNTARSYRLLEALPVLAGVGDFTLKTIVGSEGHSAFTLSGLEIAEAGQPVTQGTLDVVRTADGPWHVTGQMEVWQNTSVIQPDVLLEFGAEKTVKGILAAERFVLEDFTPASPVVRFLGLFRLVGDWTVTLDLDLPHVRAGGVEWGAVKTPLVYTPAQFKLGPLSGTVLGGALSGEMTLDAQRADPHRLVLKNTLFLKNFESAVLTGVPAKSAVTEQNRLAIQTQAEGKTGEEALEKQEGQVTLVLGNVALKAGVLDQILKGLLPALFPAMSPDQTITVGCGVVDMALKDGRLQTSSAFLDIGQASLQLDGTYDVKTQALDLAVQPHVKFSDEKVVSDKPLYITGESGAFQLSPNPFVVRGGGLAKGAMDPAFQARALAGMALDSTHPCKAFVIESEVLEAPAP